jgi:hypothetical protein
MHTMLGTYARAGGWVAVSLAELGSETLLVDEWQATPDDPEARGVVVGRHHDRVDARAEGEARVLALGGRLGHEPAQLADSPARGLPAGQLRSEPAMAVGCEPSAPTEGPVDRAQARRMFAAELGRYLHVPGQARAAP